LTKDETKLSIIAECNVAHSHSFVVPPNVLSAFNLLTLIWESLLFLLHELKASYGEASQRKIGSPDETLLSKKEIGRAIDFMCTTQHTIIDAHSRERTYAA
jgi:hypothetical protein